MAGPFVIYTAFAIVAVVGGADAAQRFPLPPTQQRPAGSLPSTAVRCLDASNTCCRFQDQEDLRCTFDRESCAIWTAEPGVREISTYHDELGNACGITMCLANAIHNIQQPAVLQSEERLWTRSGKDVRLNFKYFISKDVSRQTNLTVHAVFSTGRQPVSLITVHTTRYDAWSYEQFYLRNFGMPYSLRFTATAKCDEVIGLDNISLDFLTPTGENSCLPNGGSLTPTTRKTPGTPTTPGTASTSTTPRTPSTPTTPRTPSTPTTPRTPSTPTTPRTPSTPTTPRTPSTPTTPRTPSTPTTPRTTSTPTTPRTPSTPTTPRTPSTPTTPRTPSTPTTPRTPSTPTTPRTPSTPTTPRTPSTPTDAPTAKPPEVFHLGGYIYTKDEAVLACQDYGATLATKAQVDAAWAAGGSWCSSGWVIDQKGGLYPNAIEAHIYGCGTPGRYAVIGPWSSASKLGANCYGVKPARTSSHGRMITPLGVRGFNRFLWSTYDRTNDCQQTAKGVVCFG